MYEYTKKLLTVVSVLAVAGFGSVRTVLADQSQSPVTQVFQSAKDALDSLVSAKDEGDVNDVALRVSAFGQVLDLSTAEAKDFELKLLTADKNPDYDVWVKGAVDQLTQALVYYDSERQLLASSTPDLEGIKAMAGDFSSWRNKNYLPLSNQIQDFLLVKQEFSAISTSEKRYRNINDDLASLSLGPKNTKAINNMLAAAKVDIGGAHDLNRRAYGLFLEKYVAPLVATSSTSTDVSTSTATSSTSTATSSTDVSTSTASSTAISTGAMQATSTDETSTSTASSTDQAITVKGLVSASLDRIKDAYQNFIGISNLVRKLLQ